MIRLAVAMFVLGVLAGAQFPLKVGTQWTYEHEWESGDRDRPTIYNWTTTETITGQVTIPEGLVLLREVKPPPNAVYARSWLIARDSTPYLVHEGSVYVIGDGWDGRHRALRPHYRQSLNQGAVPPDFCLTSSREYGGVHILSSHFGSGGSMDVRFERTSAS